MVDGKEHIEDLEQPGTTEEVTEKIRNKFCVEMKWIADFIEHITKTGRVVPLTRREFEGARFSSSVVGKLEKSNLICRRVVVLSSKDNAKKDTVCAIMPTALGRKYIKEIWDAKTRSSGTDIES